MRYSRACGSYRDFLDRGLLLTRTPLNQGFLLVKLKSSLRMFYGRHHDLLDRYGISVSEITTICSTCRNYFPVLSSFMTCHWACNCMEQELFILPEHLSSPPVFSFMCMFCRSLFFLLYFFFWPLCCLFFFDIRIMIIPLVSSNSS